jgi:hypothetical protein
MPPQELPIAEERKEEDGIEDVYFGLGVFIGFKIEWIDFLEEHLNHVLEEQRKEAEENERRLYCQSTQHPPQ